MDSIADLLTRIRNAASKKKERVDVPFSKLKTEVLRILKEEGYIINFKPAQSESKSGVIRVFLKYTPEGKSVISGLRRMSRPGRRMYRKHNEIPKVKGPFGISVISTSLGVMTDLQAKKKKAGGEVICQVW